MSLRSKMLAMSTIPLIVLVFAVTYAVSAQRTAARTNEDVDRTTGVRRELAEIQHDLAIAESSVRGFVLTGQARMREDYGEAVIELRADLEDLKERVTEPLQQNRLEPLEALVEERLATLQGVLRIGRDRSRRHRTAWRRSSSTGRRSRARSEVSPSRWS